MGTIRGYNPSFHPYILLEGVWWRWHTPRWKVFLNTADKGPVMQARFVYEEEAKEYIKRQLKKYHYRANIVVNL